MPLDPFFDERLRVHRRYLFDQALGAMRARVATLWPLRAREPGVPAPAAAAPDAGEPAAIRALGPRARARARHRRAALAWDRSELQTVGTPGPDGPHRRARGRGRRATRPSAFASTTPARRATDRCPPCLAFFGGAFRIGGIDYPTTDAAFRRRAVDAGVAIVGRRLRARARASLSRPGRAGVRGARLAVRARRRARRRREPHRRRWARRPAATSPPRSRS